MSHTIDVSIAASELEAYTLNDFDYVLPEGLIAQYPLPDRSDSRMMVLNRPQQTLQHQTFRTLVEHCRVGDVLVLNNAKVMPARLIGHKEGHSGTVELFLLHPRASLDTPNASHWEVLMRPARRLRVGTVIVFETPGVKATITAQGDQGHGEIAIEWEQPVAFQQILAQVGRLPIPPYLNRPAEALDEERYQTVYAKTDGAQAAPTAGLHFTPEVLDQLRAKGVNIAEVSLMVSAGTFRPVLHDNIDHHQMDPESYTISQAVVDQITQAKAQGGRVIAVGTTVLKTLESSAVYNHGVLTAETRFSDVFIRPGFQFQVVDALLTNFHLPKSTLLMLVSAFAGHDLMMQAYQAAVAQQYRFYSYGDCMLIE